MSGTDPLELRSIYAADQIRAVECNAFLVRAIPTKPANDSKAPAAIKQYANAILAHPNRERINATLHALRTPAIKQASSSEWRAVRPPPDGSTDNKVSSSEPVQLSNFGEAVKLRAALRCL